jgi:hypothetical protein
MLPVNSNKERTRKKKEPIQANSSGIQKLVSFNPCLACVLRCLRIREAQKANQKATEEKRTK